MSEPMSAAQLAAVRACALLAEQHEPLTMTPGDLRTLLGRYQRRLHDLAEAVLPPAAMAEDPAGSQEAGALARLRAHWQDDYYVTLSDAVWSASPFADRTVILTADSAHGLKIAIQDGYAQRVSP
jgi:hypothetical protein